MKLSQAIKLMSAAMILSGCAVIPNSASEGLVDTALSGSRLAATPEEQAIATAKAYAGGNVAELAGSPRLLTVSEINKVYPVGIAQVSGDTKAYIIEFRGNGNEFGRMSGVSSNDSFSFMRVIVSEDGNVLSSASWK